MGPQGVQPAGCRVAVALGSNLGDRQSHLSIGVERLRYLLAPMSIARAIESAPVGVAAQPWFLNGAVAGMTQLAPGALLEALHAIEDERGRERPYPGAPRTLDLDLILFGDRVIDRCGLTVPHPRFRDRWFVLAPLAEIAPDMMDPVTGRSVRRLLAELG